jgi:2',3'-cyclic-nucleotide 2'-phosphodiesterase/3'-nucleotidase
MRISKGLLWFGLFCGLVCGREIRISVLATTDTHGNIYPYDYYVAQPAARGLAKIARLVETARKENPNNVLIDCGDSIQGSPIEAVYQHYVRTGAMPLHIPLAEPLTTDPVMAAMNRMGYDAMTVGNHEFNFGLKNLDRARSDARFPWLSANTRVKTGASNRPFDAYIIKEIGGVKLAIIGVTTPSIPMWDEPKNHAGYDSLPIIDTLQRVVPEVRTKHHADVVVIAAHSGLGRDLRTGVAETNQLSGENAMYDAAMKVPGIDAIVFGHTHNQVASADLNGVLLMQPKNWAISLGRIDLTLDNSSGHWAISSKTSRLIPVTLEGAVDESILEAARPYHEAAERYLNTPVATSRIELTSSLSRVEDTAILDAIQAVQLSLAKADVSFASSFNPRVRIPAGQVTVRQIAALYLYDNTLLAVEGNGRMVREALENASRYFLPCTGDCSAGPLIDRKMPGFNYDVAQGVEYTIDVSKPVGQRIRELRWKGKLLAEDQPLRIALNNYRAGGSGGYVMFRGAKVLWRSTDEIRDMIVQYYIDRKVLPETADHNWKVVPEPAAQELRREALAESRRSMTQ